MRVTEKEDGRTFFDCSNQSRGRAFSVQLGDVVFSICFRCALRLAKLFIIKSGGRRVTTYILPHFPDKK